MKSTKVGAPCVEEEKIKIGAFIKNHAPLF
jgi:hypothetical protein